MSVPDIQNEGAAGNYEDDVMVSGLWRTRDHKTMSDELTEGVLTAKQAALAAEAAQLPDIDFKNEGHGSSYAALHGGGNYVLHLKYLYILAVNLRAQNGVTVADWAKASNDAYNKCKGSPELDSPDAKTRLDNLKKATEELLEKSIVDDCSEKSPYRTYAKVLGFAMHVIGDTYAHRTIVPAYTFNNCNGAVVTDRGKPEAKSRFGTADFIAGTCSKNETIADLKTYAEDTQGHASKICHYWNCFKKLGTNKESNLEFRDVKYFTKAYDNTLYEDNTDFCPERYQDTKNSCNIFLKNSIAAKTFTYKILWPKYEIKLKGYKTLSERAAEKIDTTLAWDKMSR